MPRLKPNIRGGADAAGRKAYYEEKLKEVTAVYGLTMGYSDICALFKIGICTARAFASDLPSIGSGTKAKNARRLYWTSDVVAKDVNSRYGCMLPAESRVRL